MLVMLVVVLQHVVTDRRVDLFKGLLDQTVIFC